MNIPQLTSFAGAGAIIALIVGSWRQCVNVIRRMLDIAICRSEISDEAAVAVVSHVWEHGRKSPFGLRIFGGGRVFVNLSNRVELIGYERLSNDPMLIWYKGRPIIMRRVVNQNSGRGELVANVEQNSGSIQVYFLRGSFSVEKLVIESIAHFNHAIQSIEGNDNLKRKRFFIRRFGGKNHNDDPRGQGEPPSSVNHIEIGIKNKSIRLLKLSANDIGVKQNDDSAFNGYAFPDSVMEALTEIRTWIENEKWFRSKGIPWRRGWLLHGLPGSGKSTLVRSIALEFDLPVNILDLSSLDNETFTSAWMEIQQNAPAIALIEDIDAVFNKRENVTAMNRNKDALTFDCLLNTISGVGNSDGVFLFVTTNDVSKLDDAIGVPKNGKSTRPGRIDRVIELTIMGKTEREKIAAHILSDFPDLIASVVAEGQGYTAAQFQNLCAQEALNMFWERKKI